MNEPDYIEKLKHTLEQYEERYDSEGFQYFICATNGSKSNAFFTLSADDNVFKGLMMTAMKQDVHFKNLMCDTVRQFDIITKIVEDNASRNN